MARPDPAVTERYTVEDRDARVAIIPDLSKPAIHYKIFAAGRKDPRDSFAFVAQYLRPQDAVCIGVFPKDKVCATVGW